MPSARADAMLAVLAAGTCSTDAGTVHFADAQRAALQGSRVWTPAELAVLAGELSPGRPIVEVVDATTQRAAHDLAQDGPLALLNFASARNPGGGFLNGARAQEEDLCRCSGLYPTLVPHRAYYQANRQQTSMLYTDHAITSPGVPFLRLTGRGAWLEEPFLADVITAPAPNSAPWLARNPDGGAALRATFVRRWTHVLALARQLGRDTLVLGAWGCGAFGGDPAMAAATAKEAMRAGGGEVLRVVFAIPDAGKRGRHNHSVFAEAFADGV
jgi:uncharacterized protein (TIGR02452 family)